MKLSYRRFTGVFAAFTIALMMLLSSCQSEVFNATDLAPTEPNRTVAQTTDGKTIEFMSFGNLSENSLNKITTASEYISKNSGGDLELKANGNVKAEFKLDIPSNAIDFSKTVSMQFDDENFEGFSDIVFGPHGTQFSSPAMLDIKVDGIDLSGINPNNVGLYYVNDNGQWEEIECQEIEVNIGDGKIEVQEAELHHFSRYALAAD